MFQMSEDEQIAFAIAASMQAPEEIVTAGAEPEAGPAAVRVQIRMPSGSRVVRRFLKTALVAEIYAYVKQEAGASGGIELRAFFPPKSIGDLKSTSIEDAKLAGEAITAAIK